MPPSNVFISYRRDDAAGYARALCDELARALGPERVFIDVDDINAGQPFSDVIERAIDASAVLLVLIGRRWQGERDSGPPRIHDPADPVRREVAAGLAKGTRVIPVLLDGTPMPTEAQLPEPLWPLAGRNALAIDNARFAADVSRLIDAVKGTVGEAAPRRRRRVLVGGLAVVLLVAGAVGVLRFVGGARTGPAGVDGEWGAEVVYDWPNARYVERFVFRVDGSGLQGTASFLGVPRGLLEGRVAPDGVRFETRTAEMGGAESVHRYHGRMVDGELRFVMQTTGGTSTHVPVEFVARRDAAGAGR